MARDWESVIAAWKRPPARTEDERSANAERMVREAVCASPRLSALKLEIFTQGSYRNHTNVRRESDVDVCVRLMDTFGYDLSPAPRLTPAEAGFSLAADAYPAFKEAVGAALAAHFRTGVRRGNKVFELRENSYRVNADVAPALEHRRYYRGPYGTPYYLSGTEIRPDRGGVIHNWPHQHYENGVAKNERTGRRFKPAVRALKGLRDELAAAGHAAAARAPSFLLESLVWNVPDETFGATSHLQELRDVVLWLALHTDADAKCAAWTEVNGLKWLFDPAQTWTRGDAHLFLLTAWAYLADGGGGAG